MMPSSPSISPSAQEALRRALPAGKLLLEPSSLEAYSADGLGHKRFLPAAVVIPDNANEVRSVVEVLDRLRLPYVARGAGTSLSGGPVAAQGGVVIHLSKLRRILHIDAENRVAEVEAGVVLNQLNEALSPSGLYYPPDPSTGMVCTLGGNVASNSGGVHCFRYGVTSNYVLGLEAVLLDGQVRRFGGPAGGRGPWQQDWKRLLVGSEGTLGIFTKFWLRLIPRPQKVWTFLATYRDLESASRAIQRLVAHPAYPAAIEFMDPRSVDLVENSPMRVGLPPGSFMVLTEIDGPPPLVDGRVKAITDLLNESGASDVSLSDDPTRRALLWKARKALGGIIGKVSPDFIVQDAVIPKSALGEVLALIYREADSAGVGVVTIMHAGDGNLHPNFLFDARIPGEQERVEVIGKRLMHKVSEVGGTLSGEHGIGHDKADYMAGHFGATGSAMQMAIPSTFNPDHLINPLKVFPERRFAA